ncbi:glycosyltransferase family 2 protein [Hyphomicrobium sp.]|jgi:cellulose synthase/poly-beta-1,6-N-acetylglucosamine synthase-like glycosyltransferase|uniref:glycosyltransferase family 2 protein n=1 Tax=Hyphomicrobium sp. TaxID=82 RepID=UPI0035628D30
MVSHEMVVATAAALMSGTLGVIACLLFIPVVVLLLEVLAATLLPQRNWQRQSDFTRPSLAVLVPAHNEGANILPTLADVLRQINPRDRLLVVADNCSDDTASIARAAGAEVIERHDDENLGKGHALDYGIRHLSGAAPEVVIMVDADCRLEGGALDSLAERAFSTKRPVQALYLMRTPDDSPVNDQVSEFTWRLKNWVRPLGLFNFNLSCQLVGTGMAFPWSVLTSVNLATGALTEDLKLGLDLALKGHAPLFCPSAVVTSHFASSEQGRKTQQQRWEQGHRELIVSMVPRAFYSAIANRNLRLLAMALDLAVPPIFLLAMLLFALTAITGLAAAVGLSVFPFYVICAAIVVLSGTIVIAWSKYGRDALPPRSLASIVPYVISKLRHHLRVLAGRRATSWVRTDRN